MILINTRLGSQGTWEFMAADLVACTSNVHTFIHDLESAYWVLMSQAVRNMHSEWSKSIRSSFVNEVLHAKRYGQSGPAKLERFANPYSWTDFVLPSNKPLTQLLRSLKFELIQRYFPQIEAACTLQEFVDPKEYEKLRYKHDKIIEIFTIALQSPGWPEEDLPIKQPIARSYSAQAMSSSSSKRSRPTAERGVTSTSSKRRNLGLLT
jgi:Fungal protein kinase